MCVSPAVDTFEQVSVEVSLNGGADFTSDLVQYVAFAEASVSTLLPSRGTSGVDGQVVTVVGSNFHHGIDIRCRFGGHLLVTALFASSSHVLCSVPVHEPGVVRLDVSNNGADWSLTGVRFEYEASEGVWSMSPTRGSVLGGTRVVVSQAGGSGTYTGV